MNKFIKCFAFLVLGLPLIALAHKPSDSYLTLDLRGETLSGQWDIALRDLEYALGLDANGDAAITWGELKAQHDAIAAYAFRHLTISSDQQLCELRAQSQQVNKHSDGAYTVLLFNSNCATSDALNVDYQLFFTLDPLHRGLLQIQYPDTVQSAILSPEQSAITLQQARPISAWQSFVQYWHEGVWHIWIGFDHILFLLALLLPAVLRREQGRWQTDLPLRAVIIDVTAIVTAFTVAHSITLSLAVLSWVELPSRWVESAIAATVILAAFNNLYPLIPGRRWLIAFVLGLIHGFGFAGVLVDLGLPGNALAIALAGFNVGVEAGQLAIVAALLPLAYWLRESWFYRRAILQLGSVAVFSIALVWFVERSFNLTMLAGSQ